MTPYQLHVQKWRDGCGDESCGSVTKRCFARGKIPADVLLIGEAPGESENVIGQPFVGPAGKLLDHIVAKSVPTTLRHCFTNMVACIPYEDKSGRQKAGEPTFEAIKSCKPRLQELIDLCQPRLIVLVGKIAQDWVERPRLTGSPTPIPTVNVVHPAFILRANVAQQGLLIQRAVVAIGNAVERYVQVG